MLVALRAVEPLDIQRLDEWAANIGIDDFMSRSRPKITAATSHDPSSGLLWFVITDADIDVGTVWLEPGERPQESILGIFLGDQSAFGQGIGSQAIRLALLEFWALYPSHDVTLNVRQTNSRAIACYKKMGFSITSDGFKFSPNGAPILFFQMQLTPYRIVA